MSKYALSDYFSESFLEAKTRFIAKASEKGLPVRSSGVGMKGIDGENLSMETVEIGNPDSDNMLIVLSGTHGVEGYAGSACQLSLLDQADALALDNHLIVLVHALNPFGFSYYRRTNEENIDVNRNFADFEQAVHSNEGAEHSIVGKLRNTSNTFGVLRLVFTLLLEILRGNKEQVQGIITEGQYHHERDLFFGGFSTSKSALFWKDLIAEYQGKEIYILDIHTGLGEFGEGYVISHAAKDSEGYRNNQQYFSGLNLVHTSTDLSVSTRLCGTLSSSIPKPDNALVLEFGTRSGLNVLTALAVENHHYWKDRQSRQYDKARTRLKNAFIPKSHKWKHQVIETFWAVLEKQKMLMTNLP